MGRKPIPLSSNQPDLRVLAVLSSIQIIALIFIASIAGFTLCARLVPGIARNLHPGPEAMQIDMACLILLCAASIVLSRPRQSGQAVLASRFIGGLVSIVSVAIIVESAARLSPNVQSLATVHPLFPTSAQPTLQGPRILFILGLLLANIRARKTILANLIDVTNLGLFLYLVMLVNGLGVGAMHFIDLSALPQLPLQTLICLLLLAFVTMNRRLEYGMFSILLGKGSGGKIARLAAPCAFVLPFLLDTGRGAILQFKLLSQEMVMGLSAWILSILGFCLVIILSRRTNDLENNIRELSLRDELTQLYNRRGFYVLAEQAFLLACRDGKPFSVLFIDMDNLKQINDALGHEVGSNLLQEMAALLTQTFRNTDVIGRLGGDEFVVAGVTETSEITSASARLEEATNAANAASSRRYPLSFSVGCVVSDPSRSQTLEMLLKQADSIMYEAKRNRQRLHEEAGVTAAVQI